MDAMQKDTNIIFVILFSNGKAMIQYNLVLSKTDLAKGSKKKC